MHLWNREDYFYLFLWQFYLLFVSLNPCSLITPSLSSDLVHHAHVHDPSFAWLRYMTSLSSPTRTLSSCVFEVLRKRFFFSFVFFALLFDEWIKCFSPGWRGSALAFSTRVLPHTRGCDGGWCCVPPCWLLKLHPLQREPCLLIPYNSSHFL